MAPPSDDQGITRREMFARMFQPVRRAASAALAPQPPAATNPSAAPFAPAPTGDWSQIAVVAARYCLAYQGTPCTKCHESCPVPGALVLDQDLPRVVPGLCTGCRLCHEVCPAPDNAIRIVPRPPGLPATPPAAPG